MGGWNLMHNFLGQFWGIFLLLLVPCLGCLLGQWLNFKLFGITYLVGKIKFKLLFQGPLAKWGWCHIMTPGFLRGYYNFTYVLENGVSMNGYGKSLWEATWIRRMEIKTGRFHPIIGNSAIVTFLGWWTCDPNSKAVGDLQVRDEKGTAWITLFTSFAKKTCLHPRIWSFKNHIGTSNERKKKQFSAMKHDLLKLLWWNRSLMPTPD